MATRSTARLRYGLNQEELTIVVDVEAEQASISDRYITVHLPKSVNPAKSGWLVEGGETEVETIYDRDESTGTVEVKATAGASAYDMQVLVTGPDGNSHNSDGQTGNTISTEFTL